MKNTKVIFFAIGGLVVMVLLVGVGYYTYSSLGKDKEPTEQATGFISAPDEEDSKVPAEDLEKMFADDMTEYGVQQVIHALSHQKIKSKDGKKWGAIQITPERINRLIEVVEANEYKHKSLYLETLTNWKNGDFSQADHEHNDIWRLMGGTVGEAAGLLSPAEEQEFIDKHFK